MKFDQEIENCLSIIKKSDIENLKRALEIPDFENLNSQVLKIHSISKVLLLLKMLEEIDPDKIKEKQFNLTEDYILFNSKENYEIYKNYIYTLVRLHFARIGLISKGETDKEIMNIIKNIGTTKDSFDNIIEKLGK